jgi:hypothetical protein
LIRRPLTFTRATKFQEQLSIFSRIRISIRKHEARRQAILKQQQEWHRSRQRMSTSLPKQSKIAQVNDKSHLSIATSEMLGMPSCKWRLSKSNKRLKKRRSSF